MDILDAHPYFKRNSGSHFVVPVIGTKFNFDVLAEEAKSWNHQFHGMQLIHLRTPRQAKSIYFTRVVVVGNLTPDQKEFLAWTRFLLDPTEGLISRARNVIVVE